MQRHVKIRGLLGSQGFFPAAKRLVHCATLIKKNYTWDRIYVHRQLFEAIILQINQLDDMTSDFGCISTLQVY